MNVSLEVLLSNTVRFEDRDDPELQAKFTFVQDVARLLKRTGVLPLLEPPVRVFLEVILKLSEPVNPTSFTEVLVSVKASNTVVEGIRKALTDATKSSPISYDALKMVFGRIVNTALRKYIQQRKDALDNLLEEGNLESWAEENQKILRILHMFRSDEYEHYHASDDHDLSRVVKKLLVVKNKSDLGFLQGTLFSRIVPVIYRGQIVSIVGAPGHMKTTLAMNLAARAALANLRVVYHTLEIPADIILARIWVLIGVLKGRISNDTNVLDLLHQPRKWRKIVESLREEVKCDLIVTNHIGADIPEDISRGLGDLIHRYGWDGVDLYVMDFLNALPSLGSSTTAVVSQTTRWVRELLNASRRVGRGFWCLLLAQPSRTAIKAAATQEGAYEMTSATYAPGVEYFSDYLIHPWYNRDTDPDRLRITSSKARWGQKASSLSFRVWPASGFIDLEGSVISGTIDIEEVF